MRLINTKTLTLHEFFDTKVPQYAILSHTWAKNEITFEDLKHATPLQTTQSSFNKIRNASACALGNHRLDWIWVDTACIDKSSSAELSEAINSMFKWYEESELCIVYLADVPSRPSIEEDDGNFRRSRYFTRGWTLQELIAPKTLMFYYDDWKQLGYRDGWERLLEDVTQIHMPALQCGKLERESFSIAQRMSWASGRQTTRPEDKAYCLLGIFNVNMPLLYGEGGSRAFVRLQEEIMKNSDDQSLFVWEHPDWNFNANYKTEPAGILASDPSYFARSRSVIPLPSSLERMPFNMTNKGLYIQLVTKQKELTSLVYAALDCARDYDFFERPRILLRPLSIEGEIFERMPKTEYWNIQDLDTYKPRTMYIRTEHLNRTAKFRTTWTALRFNFASLNKHGFKWILRKTGDYLESNNVGVVPICESNNGADPICFKKDSGAFKTIKIVAAYHVDNNGPPSITFRVSSGQNTFMLTPPGPQDRYEAEWILAEGDCNGGSGDATKTPIRYFVGIAWNREIGYDGLCSAVFTIEEWEEVNQAATNSEPP
jgi:hypothetical protein